MKTVRIASGGGYAGDRIEPAIEMMEQGEVKRYELPQLSALNFVMDHALGGGVLWSLAVDKHGKSLSSALLDIEIPD